MSGYPAAVASARPDPNEGTCSPLWRRGWRTAEKSAPVNCMDSERSHSTEETAAKQTQNPTRFRDGGSQCPATHSD